MSRRTERIASRIRTIVGNAIHHELSDPRIEPLTSITKVEVSEDLSAARIHVSIMGRESRQKLTLQALASAAGHLRTLVAQETTLRHAPRLQFELDESLRRGFETVQQIDRLMDEARQRAAGASPQPGAANDDSGGGASNGALLDPVGLMDPRDLVDHTAREMPFPSPAQANDRPGPNTEDQ